MRIFSSHRDAFRRSSLKGATSSPNAAETKPQKTKKSKSRKTQEVIQKYASNFPDFLTSTSLENGSATPSSFPLSSASSSKSINSKSSSSSSSGSESDTSSSTSESTSSPELVISQFKTALASDNISRQTTNLSSLSLTSKNKIGLKKTVSHPSRLLGSDKKAKVKGAKHDHDDGPVSLAVLTDDGIMIKSRKPTTSEILNVDEINGARSSMSSSTTSFRSSSDSNAMLETASYVSCVTCLSDSASMSSAISGSSSALSLSTHNSNANKGSNKYSSVNGQIPTNSVIPYGRILNAKMVTVPSVKLNKILRNMKQDEQYLVEITFAKPRRHDVVPKRLTLLIDYIPNKNNDDDKNIIEEILKRSFKNTKRHRTLLVIINPFGGKRTAKKIFKRKARPLLQACGFEFDVQYTKYPGHAIEIAKHLNLDKYDTIACASGDGIPHEVINGLYRREDRVKAFNKLTVTQIPCGSGNAMSVSCHWTNNPSYATLCLIKSVEARVDIMCFSQPSNIDGIPKLSFLSQTYGIIAESDINTEFIRWLGPARFELGVAFNILQRKRYPCDIYVKYFAKSKNDLKSYYLENKSTSYNNNISHYDYNNSGIWPEEDENDIVTEETFKIKYPFSEGVPADWEKIDPELTNYLGIFYTGKMPYVAADTKFFPAALPSDGTMDMVITDSRTPFTRMIPILLALDKGSHVLQPEVLHSKILAYKLVPRIEKTNHCSNGNSESDQNNANAKHKEDNVPDESRSGLFSIDGEKYPLEPLQVEIIPKLCKTLLRNGSFVDTEFDSM